MRISSVLSVTKQLVAPVCVRMTLDDERRMVHTVMDDAGCGRGNIAESVDMLLILVDIV